MLPYPDEQGFTLIEVLAAMLLLSLSYVAILESFSSSLMQINKLENHYSRLLVAEGTVLNAPLFFKGHNDGEYDGELYLEGSLYKLVSIKSEFDQIETLVLIKN